MTFFLTYVSILKTCHFLFLIFKAYVFNSSKATFSTWWV